MTLVVEPLVFPLTSDIMAKQRKIPQTLRVSVTSDKSRFIWALLQGTSMFDWEWWIDSVTSFSDASCDKHNEKIYCEDLIVPGINPSSEYVGLSS